MSRRRLLQFGWIAWAAVLATTGRAQIDAPGFRPRPPGSHALTHAVVHVRPGTVFTNATVVVRDGRIVAAGPEVAAPADARTWDCTGLTIYAGFIDPYVVGATNGVASSAKEPAEGGARPEATGGPRFFGVTGEEADPGSTGPGYGIPEITPEFRVGRSWSQSPEFTKGLRELGFTAANVVPEEGIVRGQSAVVALGDTSPNEAMLRSDAAQIVAFKTRSGGEGYPKSLMGIIAVLRQTGFDARHYALDWADFQKQPAGRNRPGYNESLEAFEKAGHSQPVFMEPGSVLMVDRVARVADELGLTNRVIVASGEEWRRPDLVKTVGASFIVPVDFPALPDFPDDNAWDQVSLDELRAWDWAAENPASLKQAGKDLALTTHSLGDRKAFRKNLRAALDRGLDETDALAALTTVPAKQLGLSEALGTIEPGRNANLTIVAGSYFDPEAKVRAVWIDGRPYEFPVEPEKPETADKAKDDKAAKEKSEAKKTERRELARKRVAREPLAGRGVVTNPPSVLIRNATVWTSASAGILTNASLLVSDGRIVSVAAGSVNAPAGAFVIDGQGFHVTAGIIDCHSHSMIMGGVNEGTLPSTAMVRIGDVVNSETDNIHQQLAGGTTMANLLHGSANPIGGQNCVIKLRDGEGPEGLKLAGAPGGIKFALGENVKQANWGDKNVTRFPQTRMGVQTFYVNRFTAGQQYLADWKAWRDGGGQGVPPRRDLELEAIGEILEGTRLIHCHSYRQDEILAFLRTMESFHLRVGTLQHILEGYKVADEIAKHGAGASSFSDWWAYKYEVIDAIPYNGSLMRERGVLVSFNSDSSDHARRLNFEAAKAVKYGGTPEDEALKFVTINPAKQLGIGDRVGSLEAGKDGDFVVWSGNPLDSRSVCLQTWIEGRQYFDRSREPERSRALSDERTALLAKAKKLAGGGGDASASEKAREKFFLRVFEHARQTGVLNCEDCQLPKD
jgi:imidazolonepropionase-like amidohydrolase